MSDQYDVVVIGAGPAGYPCAIRAAQNKLKVACIDEWKNLDGSYAYGGTCLNAGCIPSKALLESSELYHRAQHEFAAHGIKVGNIELDLAAMQKRRATIVKSMTVGIGGLLKAAGAVGLQGHGKLLSGNRVEFTGKDGNKEELKAKHVILASGSTPTELKSLPFDGKNVVDSWGALEFDAVPKRLGVIGAGVIGLELGSVWRRLGAEVVVLEALDSFLPMADGAVSKEALKHFKKLGLDIRLGAKVSGAQQGASGVRQRPATGDSSNTGEHRDQYAGPRHQGQPALLQGSLVVSLVPQVLGDQLGVRVAGALTRHRRRSGGRRRVPRPAACHESRAPS